MEKAHLTLYTVIGSPQHILTGIQSLFAPVIQSVDTEADQIRVTLQDDSLLVFHLSHVREKAGFIEMHIEGMANYFAQAATSNPALKENVLRQIRCFNCVVGIVFETDDNNDRTRYLINTLFDLAHQVKGYLLYPNMHLYDGEGKLVFSREGESELTEFTPIAHADLLDGDRPEETSADRERRERSVALLQTQGIPYLETLKSEVPETEVHLKSREEMMQRAATLFAVAVYSEVMLSENPDRNEALTYFNKMDEIYGIQSWLTPAEAAYISNPDPTGQECIQFVWRYENCAVLLWAAGIVEELPYPSEICDVPVIAAIFWQHKSIGDLLGQGNRQKHNGNSRPSGPDLPIRLGLCRCTYSQARSTGPAGRRNRHGTPLYLQLDNRSQQGGSLGRYSTQYLNISERIYRYFVKEKSNLLNNPFNTKLFL